MPVMPVMRGKEKGENMMKHVFWLLLLLTSTTSVMAQTCGSS
jgi:hypothetical protein